MWLPAYARVSFCTLGSRTVLYRFHTLTKAAFVCVRLVFVWLQWGNSGSSMSWLDSPPCDVSVACVPASFTVSNIAVN